MRHEPASQFQHVWAIEPATGVDVTIVMPCLNEVQCLPHCIANANEALRRIADQYGLNGEIVIADNGSTDGSQALATGLDARVVPVAERGYGAALIGGAKAARGRYVLMGDADGSYDFTDGVAMIGELEAGAELCMGSRFKGGITPGAMPWKNRYIGNPVLTGILNLFFRPGISDAHSGLRAIRKDSFLELGLSGAGMEFASEMVIKAALKRLRIAETPVKLLPDLRDRPPHLRPWRDGWRHLRYLFMLSPTWVFGVPAAAAMAIATAVFVVGLLHLLGIVPQPIPFGSSWTIAAGFMFTTGHLALLMACATHLHGVRNNYRHLRPLLRRFEPLLRLEPLLIAGSAMIGASLAGFAAIGLYWSNSSFAALPNILPLVLCAVLGATGAQTVFGGFLLAIIAGNNATFVTEPVRAAEKQAA
jgi:glycosyl transferase family 2